MRRASTATLLVAAVAIGLAGSYSYWENYYVHRGFATPTRLSGATPGRLFKVRFRSRSLGRPADYMVYLPSGYSSSRPLPAFYLLHGIPGRPIAYSVIGHIEVRLDNLISRARAPRMILVFPDGRIAGSTFSDSEWANTSSGRFESYVVEVVRDVDHRFATLPGRSHRVIGGLSAGGYGALNVALHHLNVFGNVQVWSGYFRQSRTGVFAGAGSAELAYNSPIEYVRRLRRALARFPLRAFLFAGSSDRGSVRQLNAMAGLLRVQGADAAAAVYPGGHDWALWNGHLDQMLSLAGRDALLPLAARRPGLRRERRPGYHRVLRRQASRPSPWTAGAEHADVSAHGIWSGGTGGLLGGLILALLSAAAINLGFLLQHRGLQRIGPGRTLPSLIRHAWRTPAWLGGQALGCAGFAAQILAVSIAPLSLVQAFAAGGLALSVPLAATLFGHEISRAQRTAVLIVAAALATLPIGLSAPADRLDAGSLVALAAVVGVVAAPLGFARGPSARALAAGLFYGIADAAIKAVSVQWSAHGAGALGSWWTVLAVLATFGGFLAFQSSLRDGNAVSAISLSTAAGTLVALGASLIAFGESLGRGPAAVSAHVLAIALVLGCVPVLAAAQAELAEVAERTGSRGPRLHPGRLAAAAWLRGEHRAAGGK